MITKIKSFGPKVVGLDILFIGNKDPVGDLMLEEAVKSGGNTVIVNKLTGYDSKSGNYDSLITSMSRITDISFSGYANFPSKDGSNFTTIRMFKPSVKLWKDIIMYAFAASAAKLYNPKAFNYLISRMILETINYRGNIDKFYFVRPHKLRRAWIMPVL